MTEARSIRGAGPDPRLQWVGGRPPQPCRPTEKDPAEPCRSCDRSGGPEDLRALPPDAAARARRRDPRRAGHQRGARPAATSVPTSARRADHRAAPGLRLPARADRLRHRPPGLRAQDAHRPGRRASTGCASAGGLSGYPSRAESEHDWVENSHASTSLSYADGLAKAFAVRGEHAARRRGHRRRRADRRHGLGGAEQHRRRAGPPGRHRGQRQRPLVLADHRRRGRRAGHACGCARATSRRWTPSARRCTRAPVVGTALYDALHAIKKGLKDVLSPQGMFEDLGMKYVGPVDGHDIKAMESALRRARAFGGPVIVHAVTTKGFGYPPAETDQIDAWHATGVFDPDSGAATRGRPATGPRRSPTSWCAIGAERPDVVAITAAMLHPTGLAAVRRARSRSGPSTSASPSSTRSPPPPGWRMGGLHPVVARLLDVPQPGVRPAADGRRPAPAAGDRRPRPGRA